MVANVKFLLWDVVKGSFFIPINLPIVYFFAVKC